MHSATQAALQAFEDMERVRLLLERKEREHAVAVARAATEAPEDEASYYKATEDVLGRYAAKREKEGL